MPGCASKRWSSTASTASSRRRGQLAESDRLALLAVRAEVGADQLGLEQDGRDLAAGVEVADRLDLRSRQPHLDTPGGLGAGGVLEGAQVRDGTPLLPVDAARRRDLGRTAPRDSRAGAARLAGRCASTSSPARRGSSAPSTPATGPGTAVPRSGCARRGRARRGCAPPGCRAPNARSAAETSSARSSGRERRPRRRAPRSPGPRGSLASGASVVVGSAGSSLLRARCHGPALEPVRRRGAAGSGTVSRGRKQPRGERGCRRLGAFRDLRPI